MTIAKTVQDSLQRLGVSYDIEPHPRSCSSRELAEVAHVQADHIAKAVVLKHDSGFAMAVIPGDAWLKLGSLGHELYRDFELASESESDSLFADCVSGAVPPLGPQYGLETFLDEALCSLANVFFESGDHEHLIHVSGEDFLRLLGGSRRGHYSRGN